MRTIDTQACVKLNRSEPSKHDMAQLFAVEHDTTQLEKRSQSIEVDNLRPL